MGTAAILDCTSIVYFFTMASTKVTVEKAYLDTLMRKAQFHTDGVDYSVPVRVPTVTITKVEHDSLLKASREYGELWNHSMEAKYLESNYRSQPPEKLVQRRCYARNTCRFGKQRHEHRAEWWYNIVLDTRRSYR